MATVQKDGVEQTPNHVLITGALRVGMLFQQRHKDWRSLWVLHVGKRSNEVAVVWVVAQSRLKYRNCPFVSSLGYCLHSIVARCGSENLE
ncbi:MAG: hypothetical protein ACYSYL_18285 [Planctomycetota bacterium]